MLIEEELARINRLPQETKLVWEGDLSRKEESANSSRAACQVSSVSWWELGTGKSDEHLACRSRIKPRCYTTQERYVEGEHLIDFVPISLWKAFTSSSNLRGYLATSFLSTRPLTASSIQDLSLKVSEQCTSGDLLLSYGRKSADNEALLSETGWSFQDLALIIE
jgi:hypothetical protein